MTLTINNFSQRKTTPVFLPTISKSSTTTQTPTTTTTYTTSKKYQKYKSVRPTSTTTPTTLRKIKRRPQIAVRKPTEVNNATSTKPQNDTQFRKKNETRLLNSANIEQIISEASNVVSSHIADNSYLSNNGGSNVITNLDTASNYVSAGTPLSDTNSFLLNTPKGSYFNTQAISEAAAAKVLFSTDLLTPKFNLDQTGFGYFKPSYSSHSSSDKFDDTLTKAKRQKPSTFPPAPSVEFNLETELAIANLPLQSSYSSINAQHYRRPPPVYPGFYRGDHHHRHHGGVASSSQIQLYNDDLRLQHETRVIEQLANNPHPADKGKYYQYLKSKEDEKLEKFTIRDQTQRRQQPILIRPKSQQPIQYHKTILVNSNGPPQHLHFVKKPTDRPVSSLGLSHYKTQLLDRSYSYPFI